MVACSPFGSPHATGPSPSAPASGGATATPIAAGYSHTCAITRTGGVKCWGDNGDGELGDGTTSPRRTPVAVLRLGKRVRSVAAGVGVSCVVTKAGGAKCWGSNGHGELGDGTTTDRHVPVPVSGLAEGVRAIVAGEALTCALTTAGAVKCWGYNRYGELGDGTTADRQTPVTVTGLARVSAIAVGYLHACALTTAGGVKCWGYNGYGQLGDGTTSNRQVPVEVAGLAHGVIAITAGGGHSCALTSRGGVVCWGSNSLGELGDGTTTRRLTPVGVAGLARGIAAIAAGGEAHGCALTRGGSVECWGYNGYGQLGDGTTTDRHAPVAVSGLAGIQAIAAGGFGHSCSLTSAGEVSCWGRNTSGQLGDGSTDERHARVRLVPFAYYRPEEVAR
jgi:alpha-tubulin suppressor-like RCC1 family protein